MGESEEEEKRDLKEFTKFCEAGSELRDGDTEVGSTEECSQIEPGAFDQSEDLPLLFTLIVICGYGALVRAVCKRFKIKIPYTVILLVSGFAMGIFHLWFCEHIYKYTAIARVNPKHILFIFLPILIFESAFNIPVHIFVKSLSQILILAFPGMIISCISTAFICQVFFHTYNWNFMTACLFGCIISATDPVAVVAILKDLGVSENLGVLIDGESLLNDGVAIVLFEIFKHSLVKLMKGDTADERVIEVIFYSWHSVLFQFFKVALGAPALGFVIGKFIIFLLYDVYNDAPVEIATTLCASYLTYWISEMLHLSGVLSVVALGVTMSAQRTVISPESEGPVHHFWEMIGYLANTVLFVIVGIVIAETNISHFEITDVLNLILLYIVLHLIRFLILLTFYPILRQLGYGLEWQNLIVIMWGGLRGAVGICLALEIYEDVYLCEFEDIGPKILFHTGGIVLLTLVINGTTTKILLRVLGLTDITQAQRDEMINAIRRVRIARYNMTRSFQMNTFFIGARWDEVEKICRIDNPYRKPDQNRQTGSKKDGHTLKPPQPVKDNTTICYHCANIVENEPTVAEYRQLADEARLRAIKTMISHYKQMFEEGLLTEEATQELLAIAENAEDKYLGVIEASSFRKYLNARGFYSWIRQQLVNIYKRKLPSEPRQKWRLCFYRVVTRDLFEYFILCIVVLHIGVIIGDICLYYLSDYPNNLCKWAKREEFLRIALFCLNVVFTACFTIECALKIIGLGPTAYFCDPWTYVDILALSISYVDLIVTSLTFDKNCTVTSNQTQLLKIVQFLRFFKIVQVLKSVRLLKIITPHVLRLIRHKTNMQIFTGYDMAQGFVETSDAVIRFVPQMSENKKVQKQLKQALKRERKACLKDLALFNKKNPEVATAVKTRHACRAVLNDMALELNEVKEKGMLDDTDHTLLKHTIEKKQRRLVNAPTFIQPTTSTKENSNSNIIIV